MKQLLLLVTVFSFSLTAAPNFTRGTASGPNGSSVNLDLGGGLITTSGTYAGDFLTSVHLQVDRTTPVRIGLASGILFGSGTALPILAVLHYDFGERSRSGRLFIEGLVGPTIGLGGVGVFRGLGDDVKLAILLKPGIAFAVADKLDLKVDLTIGGLTGLFYVSTNLNLSVHL